MGLVHTFYISCAFFLMCPSNKVGSKVYSSLAAVLVCSFYLVGNALRHLLQVGRVFNTLSINLLGYTSLMCLTSSF